MNILITGIAGFIGFHITRQLLEEGHHVYGIDNLADNGDLSIKLMRLNLLGIAEGDALDASMAPTCNGNLSFLRMDLKDKAHLIDICHHTSFEHIIHLAAITGVKQSRLDPASYIDNNVGATKNVLEAARLCGVKHLFFSSSAVVHGAHSHAPQTEEDDVDNPLNVYAGSKRAAEILCYTYSQTFRLPVTVFRIFTAYGPWGRPDSVPMLLARDIMEGNPIRVVNDGYLVRDFTYVDDIVDGIMAAISSPPFSPYGNLSAPYALYNIGRSKPVALLTFIQAMESALGRSAHVEIDPTNPISMGISAEIYADTTKLERQLAYSPVWAYDEAMPSFIEWFLEHYGRSFTM